MTYSDELCRLYRAADALRIAQRAYMEVRPWWRFRWALRKQRGLAVARAAARLDEVLLELR